MPCSDLACNPFAIEALKSKDEARSSRHVAPCSSLLPPVKSEEG